MAEITTHGTPVPTASADPAASPLEHVVDDYLPRYEALEWAVEELAGGRGFEAVNADLVQQGWGQADADEIVEDARQATRSLRGAVTRDQVIRESNRRYRATMTNRWFVAFPGIMTVIRLVHALGSFASLTRRRRDEAEDEARHA